MSLNNITSANASAILTVESLYPSGIVLEQFSIDQGIIMEDVQYSVSRMGIDGKMTSGFIPSIKSVNIVLEASSPSLVALTQLAEMMVQNKTTYACNLMVEIPALSKSFNFSNGVLESGKIFPENKKVLEPVNFRFQFESFTTSSL